MSELTRLLLRIFFRLPKKENIRKIIDFSHRAWSVSNENSGKTLRMAWLSSSRCGSPLYNQSLYPEKLSRSGWFSVCTSARSPKKKRIKESIFQLVSQYRMKIHCLWIRGRFLSLSNPEAFFNNFFLPEIEFSSDEIKAKKGCRRTEMMCVCRLQKISCGVEATRKIWGLKIERVSERREEIYRLLSRFPRCAKYSQVTTERHIFTTKKTI